MILWWYNIIPLLGFAIGGVVFMDVVIIGSIEMLVVKKFFEISFGIKNIKTISFFKRFLGRFFMVIVSKFFLFFNVIDSSDVVTHGGA
jgi:hypothetical protein